MKLRDLKCQISLIKYSDVRTVTHVNIFHILDNFGETELDFLQSCGSARDARTSLLGRDSILSSFDPLLEKPVLPNTFKKLPVTEEEEEAHLRNASFNQDQPSAAPFSNASSEIVKQCNEMSLSSDIMKDISVENKSLESNHIECEENKLK